MVTERDCDQGLEEEPRIIPPERRGGPDITDKFERRNYSEAYFKAWR